MYTGVIFTVNNNDNPGKIPMGLSVALYQNSDAMSFFGALSPDEQQEIINHTHTIQSNQDIQDFLDSFPSFL